MNKLNIEQVFPIKKIAGIGYELYAKGLDRVAAQCNQISDSAKKLAKLVRENATTRQKKKALKELQKWVNSVNGEMKGIVEDVDNLEGYKSSAAGSKFKKAAGETILEMLMGKSARDISVRMRNSMDDQTRNLALQVWMKLNEILTLKGDQKAAFNRLYQSIDAGKNYSESMHRNNIFKAADLLGIKLPSGVF